MQSLSVFGTVIAMRLLLIYLPIVCSPQLVLFEKPLLNALAKFMLVYGGIEAAKKSTAIVTGILADSAGWQSVQAGDMSTSANRMVGKAAGLTMGAVGMAAGVAGSTLNFATKPLQNVAGRAWGATGGKLAEAWKNLGKGDVAGEKAMSAAKERLATEKAYAKLTGGDSGSGGGTSGGSPGGGSSGSSGGGRELPNALSRKLEKHPAIRLMMQDTKTVGLLRSGNGNGLLRLLADKETERQHSFDRFRRPEEFVKEDAGFLKTAADRLKQKPPLASADGKNDPEKDKRYQEMMKRLEHAQDLADHGVQLSGEKTKELIKAVKAYNDAGDKKLPADAGEAEGHLEAMCILSRYMPEKDFRAYCKQLNKAHGAANPRQSRYEDPEAYPADRLEGGAKTAKEWYTDSKTRLMKNFSIEGCAEVAAIRRLSQGNPHKVIRRDELEGETKRLCEPGSALSRTLKDEKAREEYVHLASMGEAEDLGTDLLAAAKKHSARAAQWQVNRSIRELVSGPVNPYVAAENLANILAARELAVRGDAGNP